MSRADFDERYVLMMVKNNVPLTEVSSERRPGYEAILKRFLEEGKIEKNKRRRCGYSVKE